ncbi:ABC transporter permease [Pontibacter qinzhouensis]|nr:ABC transporter permease [Pontibacter qinzhouensis]
MPNDINLDKVYAAPCMGGSNSNWFGTDALGRDVFANTLFGARTAILISFPVASFTALLGLVLGTTAGFFGDSGFKTKRVHVIVSVIAAVFLVYLGLYVPIKARVLLPSNTSLIYYSVASLILVFVVLWGLARLLWVRFAWFHKPIALPVDQIILRIIETLTSVPRLIFILVLASFLPPTVPMLAILLALTYWTGIARLARAEMLKIKNLPYFESARSIGVTQSAMVFRHALPNMLGPLLISFTFALASLLTFESTLSFLGIGIPNTLPSWGRTIAGIRHNAAAWWLLAFPGTFLLATVMALQVTNYYILAIIQARKK